jgi:hypothetical protein
MFELAIAGDTTLLIFLAKTMLGLREKEKSDVSVNVRSPETPRFIYWKIVRCVF